MLLLVGSAPDITRHFYLSFRGIGIIDVRPCLVLRVLRIPSLSILLSSWKSGTATRSTTVWDFMRSIRSILETRSYAIPFRFVRDVIWLLSLSLQPLTTDRRRWATMQLRSCTSVFRRTLPKKEKNKNQSVQIAGILFLIGFKAQ